MAKDRDRYRLWQHEVKPPKKSEQTVIAKVSANAAAVTLPDAKSRRATLKALREDDAISYVDTPKTRRLL